MSKTTNAALSLAMAAGAVLPTTTPLAAQTVQGSVQLVQLAPPAKQDPQAAAAAAERKARAEAARQQAEQARQRAEQARQQAEAARRQAEAARKQAAEQRQREEAARRAKADADRNRIQAEREKAQAERRREEDARRAKADADRNRIQAEREKAQADRRREEEARRAKADAERGRNPAERQKALDDRTQANESRRDTRQGPPAATGTDPGRPASRDGGPRPDAGRIAPATREAAPAGTSRAPSARAPGAPPTSTFVGKGIAIRDNMKLDDLRRLRQQRIEAGGQRTIIREPGGRQIVRERNKAVIVNSDTSRLRWNSRDVQTREGAGGTRTVVVRRPNGMEIVTLEDAQGRVLRRARRDRTGREHVFFQNRDRPSGWTLAAVAVAVAVPTILIARHLYEVDAREARYEDVYDAFRSEPVSRLDRVYSLDEVRYNYALRAHMRSVDVNTITFDSGSWEIEPSQFRKLDNIARAIDDVLRDNPDEVFLIEGHTDAVGDPEDNLTLSDRRAESVARVLTEEFGIPPENLTTQGYGEEFLKVPTSGSDERNRRVVIRRITPLVSEGYRR